MQYAIYFTWKDDFEDTMICDDREDKDYNIENMLHRNEFKSIEYCMIHKNGEYGKRKKVL